MERPLFVVNYSDGTRGVFDDELTAKGRLSQYERSTMVRFVPEQHADIRATLLDTINTDGRRFYVVPEDQLNQLRDDRETLRKIRVLTKEAT